MPEKYNVSLYIRNIRQESWCTNNGFNTIMNGYLFKKTQSICSKKKS